MPEIKLTIEEMRYMSLFQDLTGTTVRDCIIDNDNNTIVFIVKEGEGGLAVGKGGSNIKMARKLLGKNVEVVEYSEDFEQFVKNIFMPARIASIRKVQQGGRNILYVNVHPEDKGLAIGKGGRNIHRARLILKRYYDIDNVIVV
ncbi:MAG: NusA-like transcription termination signal-binding factor [Sulfolobales archaeon]